MDVGDSALVFSCHKSAAVAPLWIPHHAYRMSLPYVTAGTVSCLINQAIFSVPGAVILTPVRYRDTSVLYVRSHNAVMR